jgi:hypothetical protein
MNLFAMSSVPVAVSMLHGAGRRRHGSYDVIGVFVVVRRRCIILESCTIGSWQRTSQHLVVYVCLSEEMSELLYCILSCFLYQGREGREGRTRVQSSLLLLLVYAAHL